MMYQFDKLDNFLKQLQGDVYPELPGEPHLSITQQMIDRLLTKYDVGPGKRVLDIGCGQGLALRRFVAEGLVATGIALGDDVIVCQKEGFDVQAMDQSFLEFDDDTFDVIWCRHAIEHSIFPFFTLFGFHKVLNPSGILYVEVPAPDTSCHHEQNPNHYSVFGKSLWRSLFERSGFLVDEELDINFTVPAGPDLYWCFFLRPYHQELRSGTRITLGDMLQE